MQSVQHIWTHCWSHMYNVYIHIIYQCVFNMCLNSVQRALRSSCWTMCCAPRSWSASRYVPDTNWPALPCPSWRFENKWDKTDEKIKKKEGQGPAPRTDLFEAERVCFVSSCWRLPRGWHVCYIVFESRRAAGAHAGVDVLVRGQAAQGRWVRPLQPII